MSWFVHRRRPAESMNSAMSPIGTFRRAASPQDCGRERSTADIGIDAMVNRHDVYDPSATSDSIHIAAAKLHSELFV
jgi:hypothetical protein